MKITKNRKRVQEKIEKGKTYSITEAIGLLKKINYTKFDASIDLHVRLGVDPRKADQAIRGTVVLPHGTGKRIRILVLCPPEYEEQAKQAGADYVGLKEYIQKIQQGWTDFDVVIATPDVMPQIARIGRILGPRNLMPNPKSDTVTTKIGDAVKEVKKGKISFKVDKYGIIHTSVGRVSFTTEQIAENIKEMIKTLIKMKPPTARGTYFKSIYLATTMSPSILLDTKLLIAS